MRVLSHSDTHYLNGDMGWCGCHERSDQSRSPQGYMACCGCHEILIAICYPQEIFNPDQTQCIKAIEIFCLEHKRNAQRCQWNTNVRHKKMNPDEWKDVMPRNCWFPVTQPSCFSVEFVRFVINCVWALSFSVPSWGCWLWLLSIRHSKLNRSSIKWQSLWRIVDRTEQSFFPCRLIEFRTQFHALVHTRNWLVCSSHPWFHCALWSALGLLRKYLHSLTPIHNHCCNPLRFARNTTPQGVLSPCWCSLTLTLTTLIEIWDGAGATKSWLYSGTLKECGWEQLP